MLRLGCAWYCAMLLWMSGTQHVANKYVFFGTILDYQLIPTSLASITAAVLPWLHLMLAAVLIAPGIRSKTPFTAAAMLGAVFLTVQSTVLLRGIPVDCGCFGAMAEQPVGIASLALASSLAGVGVLGAVLTVPSLQDPSLDDALSHVDGVSEMIDADLEAVSVQATTASCRSTSPGISIIMPVYNELTTIDEVVTRVRQVADDCGWDWELLIVDDGSSDGTAERIKQLADLPGVRVLMHPANRGKGAAIRTALEVADRELTVIQDADLEYDPQQIDALIRAMDSRQVDVVYGSRVLGAKTGIATSRRNIYSAGVSVLNLAVRLLYGWRVTDEATCYKLFRTADLRRMQLTCEGFEFCPEVTAKAARLGLSIVEIPISYYPRSTDEGKKIRFKDAVCAIQTLWKFRRWQPLQPPTKV
ncbi:Undecaprenyl-phosphate mannosyltransferase [Maioricimonas rarisocia]|uniref:Undecaprenyl-phosphate mannosyltransferase n=1 Tax=Maioricimonas rarisocia TaxID=2528026 RepID=A0A517Z775_9PLAN|nr:glycosyltransferase [Maioricimonas rarisocia]QDU38342.1 Undecaprenyl-phosphate mannosyltransferase [Maioricimonas rarisocia]